MSINKTIIQGRLTRDPELRSTNTGKPVCSFNIAWSEKFKDTEQKVFLTCVAWDKNAEFASKHFAKGQECVVEGKLFARKFTDKSGNDREIIELNVERMHFCGKKEEQLGNQVSHHGGYSGFVPAILDVAGEDLPF